jgi:HlyD family type I secretion membrane fusion protein
MINMRKKEPKDIPAVSLDQGKTMVKENSALLRPSRVLPPDSNAALREKSVSSLPAIMAGLLVLALFFAAVVLWNLYVPLKNVINVPGEVAFKNKRQPVQHLEGGIVKKIMVRDGDLVKAGQPLIVLASSQVQPIVNLIEEQSVAETALIARLEAESKDLKSIVFPRSLLERSRDSSVAKIIQSEEKLFNARRDSFQHQLELIRLQMSQLKESYKGSQERLSAKTQEIAFIKDQLAGNQNLLKEGYVTKTAVTDMQRLLLEKTGEREVLVASMASDKQRLAELEQRILALKADRVQGAITEIKQSSLRRIDQEERIRPMRDTLERQVIRAPVTGKVVGLKVTTVGGVILPRESLMEIASTDDNLILEAKIDLKDISDIKVGQEAEVRITGFDTRTTPLLNARITYVSDDRLIASSAQGQQQYYAAYLELDQASLKSLGTLRLMPGMSAQITIATKPRSPFDFIIAHMRESFRKAVQTK